jgi:GAF domain-containing protein
MDPKQARSYLLQKSRELLNFLDDPAGLQGHVLEVLLGLTPAKRGAILLYDTTQPPDPRNFSSYIYAERPPVPGDELEFSSKALDFVYANRQACMSNDARPAMMCAPLILPDSTTIGLIYLDTSELGIFEMDDLGVLKDLAGSAANLIHDSLKRQARRKVD